MQKFTALLLTLGIFIVLPARTPGQSAPKPRPDPPARAKPVEKVPTVNQLMSEDPPAGRASVIGVVQQIGADGRLTLIDPVEYAEIVEGTVEAGCNPLQLPVQWAGAAPRLHATIRVTGRIVKTGEKQIFVAESLVELPAGAEH